MASLQQYSHVSAPPAQNAALISAAQKRFATCVIRNTVCSWWQEFIPSGTSRKGVSAQARRNAFGVDEVIAPSNVRCSPPWRTSPGRPLDSFVERLVPGRSTGWRGVESCRSPDYVALLVDDPSIERILRIVIAGRRRVPRRDQRIDQRLVVVIEFHADGRQVVVPLLERARAADDRTDDLVA